MTSELVETRSTVTTLTPAARANRSVVDSRDAAVSAGLTYVCADSPGIARRRAGRGFSYRDSAGHRIADAKTLGRIRRLVIPAGWRAVWICAEPDGHIQAIDLDEKGRRQYRYHPRYRDVREGAKFQHMMAFAESLPTLGHRRAQGAIASVA